MSPEPWTKESIHKINMSPIRRTRNSKETKSQMPERHRALEVSLRVPVSLRTEGGTHLHY